jgi:hypothetical protein
MNFKYTFILFIILLILLLFPLTIFRESMFRRDFPSIPKPSAMVEQDIIADGSNPPQESPPADGPNPPQESLPNDESNPSGEVNTNSIFKGGFSGGQNSIFNRGISSGAMPNNEIDKCSALLSANGISGIANGIGGGANGIGGIANRFGFGPSVGVTGANSSSAIAGADIGTDSAYSYLSFIKTPAELQMSDNGTLDTLEKDINGLTSYVELLVEGTSNASKTNGPLGNKFFVKTLGTCKSVGPKDKDTEQTRYFYVNNVPLGKNPMPGSNYKDYRGLIPGMLENVDSINPEKIASAFLTNLVPDCMEITLDTINSSGTLGSASHYVSLADIAELDPCLFPDRVNPQTNAKCTGLAGPGQVGPGSAGPGQVGPGSAGPGQVGPGSAGPGPDGYVQIGNVRVGARAAAIEADRMTRVAAEARTAVTAEAERVSKLEAEAERITTLAAEAERVGPDGYVQIKNVRVGARAAAIEADRMTRVAAEARRAVTAEEERVSKLEAEAERMTTLAAEAERVGVTPGESRSGSSGSRFGGFRGPGTSEGFESMHDIYSSQTENETKVNDLIEEDIKTDYISQLFLSSFSLLGIYILFLTLKKFK